MVNLAAEVAACLQRERAYLLVHVHERNPHTDAAWKCGSVTMPALRPLAALPPVVALDALRLAPAQGILEGSAELRGQHESAADRVVDMALVCVDEMVGAFRRRDDSHDGDFVVVSGTTTYESLPFIETFSDENAKIRAQDVILNQERDNNSFQFLGISVF